MRLLIEDCRHAARMLRRDWTVAAAVVLCLASGIGFNTAVFSVVDAVMLRPLPYKTPSQLIIVLGSRQPSVRRAVNENDLLEWAGRSRTVTAVAPFQLNPTRVHFTSEDVLDAAVIGPGVFEILGVAPALGRTFYSSDRERSAFKRVILSHALWTSRFGARADVIGQSIRINDERHEVIGVMPRHVFFPDTNTSLWVLLPPRSNVDAQVHGLARLHPSVAMRQLAAELDVSALGARKTGGRTREIGGFSLQRLVLGDYEAASWALYAAASVLLLVACVNVGGVLLARGIGQAPSYAMRAALGARPVDLVRLVSAEAALLTVAAFGLGLGLSYATVVVLRGLPSNIIPRFDAAGINTRSVIYAGVVSAVSLLIAAIAPAVAASRVRLPATLPGSGIVTASRSVSNARQILVLLQVAATVVLVAAAGLLVNSFIRISRANWGFEADNVVLAELKVPRERIQSAPARIEFTEAALDRLSRIEGVRSTAMAYGVPIRWDGWKMNRIAIDGRKWPGVVPTWTVSHGYFRTMGIPILKGREFVVGDDREHGHRPVVVSDILARELWGGRDPIEQQLTILKITAAVEQAVKAAGGTPDPSLVESPAAWEPDGPPYEVVGVVGNVRMFGLGDTSSAAMYVDYRHDRFNGFGRHKYVVAVRDSAERHLREVASALSTSADGVTIERVLPMSELVSRSVSGRGSGKLLLFVTVMFAAISVLLSAAGVYGIAAFVVQERRREIGVRRALGASQAALVRTVFARAVRPVMLGILLGVVAAIGSAPSLDRFLFGVRPTDVWTFAAVVAVMIASTAMAIGRPMLSALKVSPSDALREE